MVTKKEFTEKILTEYPRMEKTDKFKFACHPGVSCFNQCCNDVNIFLTPYDIIRVKNRLGITSGEFLEKYTLLPIEENLKHPIIMLRMDEETKNCPFVGKEGCTVYEDRPWSCRMFPVGVASPKEVENNDDKEFFFLLKEDVCKGFDGGNEWTVEEWMKNQGVDEYVELGDMFKDVSLHEYFTGTKGVEPVKLEMFYMACYDLDKFRTFVFGSTFLKRFKVDAERIEKIKKDDTELLKFGFDFIRFSLFGEKTLQLCDEYSQQTR
ncbi:MAG: YkgJ family cysteine cluster protein [Candidatus Kapabacteria bacterium]|jgi:Fe-S-cluster containining protein|nr:YkgJ family cysteine cluster protein [Candidatus Kapabacteria bacterium]